MPILLLIRHGENEYTRTGRMAGRLPDVHLNKKGQEQARELAETLAEAPLAAVYASPLERALETAQIIAEKRELEVNVRPGLVESDIGEWQGVELKKAHKFPEWKFVQATPSRFRFPGGESFLEMQTRLVSEVEAIAKAHQPNELVALVFHADPIKLVLAHYLGMPLDHFQRLACDTASVSVLFMSEGSVMLYKQNLRPPFKLPEPPKPKQKKVNKTRP